MREPVDLYAPSAPGSLMRALRVGSNGLFRLSRRPCALYSVQIVSSGVWGRARVMDGDGRKLWEQPSTFTGSFWLGAGSLFGLLVEMSSDNADDAANLTINWTEQDTKMI